jgi:hypothetical protein
MTSKWYLFTSPCAVCRVWDEWMPGLVLDHSKNYNFTNGRTAHTRNVDDGMKNQPQRPRSRSFKLPFCHFSVHARVHLFWNVSLNRWYQIWFWFSELYPIATGKRSFRYKSRPQLSIFTMSTIQTHSWKYKCAKLLSYVNECQYMSTGIWFICDEKAHFPGVYKINKETCFFRYTSL